jgi:hypothetical protein
VFVSFFTLFLLTNMKRFLLLWIGLSLPAFLFSQGVPSPLADTNATKKVELASADPLLDLFLVSEQKLTKAQSAHIQIDMAQTIRQFKEEVLQKKSDIAQLELLHQLIRRKYLLEYKQCSPFAATLAEGRYDCLSGSMIYAYLLDKLGFSFSAYETNYHVYLIVHLPGTEVLIESTDSKHGLVKNQKHIDYRLREYEQKYVETHSEMADWQPPIHRSVSLRGLAGLQFFNRAVLEYNEKHFGEALADLQKAKLIYPCERVKGLLAKVQHLQHSERQ